MAFNKEKALKKKAEIAYRKRMIDDQYPMEDTFKMNKKVEEELDNQFPKGNKLRGNALVLHSIELIS